MIHPAVLRVMSVEQLQRKSDQHWHMAALARQDRDSKGERSYTQLAQTYDREISERR